MAEDRLLSPSQINTYLSCPRKYYYDYVLGLPKEETFSQVRGTVVHSVCEEFFDWKPPPGIAYRDLNLQMREHALGLFGRVWSHHDVTKRFGDDKLDDTRAMVERFVLMHKWKMDAVYERTNDPSKAWAWNAPKFREHHIVNRDIMLQGYLDAVLEKEGEGTIIVDYKTSQLYKTPASEEYARQMYLYALLYKRATNVLPSYGVFEFLRYGQSAVFWVREEFVSEMENLVHTVRRKTRFDDMAHYPANVGYKFCAYCDFRERCKSDGE